MQHVSTLTRTIPHTRTHKYSPQFFTQGNTNMPQILSLANTRTRTILHTRLQHNSSHTRKHTNTHNFSQTRRHAQFLTHTQTYRHAQFLTHEDTNTSRIHHATTQTRTIPHAHANIQIHRNSSRENTRTCNSSSQTQAHEYAPIPRTCKHALTRNSSRTQTHLSTGINAFVSLQRSEEQFGGRALVLLV